jgi:biopolymer transport protein ExbB/TolQ
MQEFMTIVILASVVFGIILLVSWFNTVRNVRQIREMLQNDNSLSLLEEARMYEFMQDKPNALSCYLKALYNEVKHLDGLEKDSQEHLKKGLRKRYWHLIERNGGKWPDFSILAYPE